MAILKIAKMGDPVLRGRAQEVPDPTVPQIRALVADMVETLADAGGVGLAAPQVHEPLRIVIFHRPREATEPEDAADAQDIEESGNAGDPAADQAAPEDDDDLEDDGPGPLFILVNPLIEPLTDEMALDWEACLSVPRMRGVVPRFT
ncbi:MAG: peptide deformylase, partial [Alphaproteobacteria bacterium]